MTGLTYQGKPARLDVHLPDGCPPVGFMHQNWPELIPRLAREGEVADYYVIKLSMAAGVLASTASAVDPRPHPTLHR